MELKVLNILVLTVLALVISSLAFPRDSGVVKVEQVEHIIYDDTTDKVEPIHLEKNEINIAGRVSCEYDEATEDPVCQEHCFPKGYKYGLCVSRICSCI